MNMKNRLYIITTILAGAFALTSCADWFDISPKTDVKADDLYETENGFVSSLAGIYVLMTDEGVYGSNMSFGLLDQLVQMYDLIPDGATTREGLYNYIQSSSGYNTKGKLQTMWLNSYNIIANANNLLKWLDKKGDMVILDDNTRNMLRGEALALRAYLHFDLLRGWGPMNYAGNPDVRTTKCMPYRTVTDESKQPLLPANKIVENIIADLDSAKECLSYEKKIQLAAIGDESKRRFRMNYHAVNALMARVYNYAGESELAKFHAKAVIDSCGLRLQTGNDEDPVLFSETISGVNIYQMLDFFSDYFDNGEKITQKYYLTLETKNLLFETSGSESQDMRAKSTAFLKSDDGQKFVTRKYIKNDNEIIPLIRLPEMYYIMAEASEGEEAAYYINTVRNKRGISSTANVVCNTPEQKRNALSNEYRKEVYAEGQYFYFLKSHGITGTLPYNEKISLQEEQFVFPLPDGEKEYGWVEENDENENK